MFVQVIKGHTSDPAGLRQQMDTWRRDLKPGAVGFEGTTGGIADDGTVILLARFADADAARRNADRPEQGAWWEQTAKYFDSEPTFRESTDTYPALTFSATDFSEGSATIVTYGGMLPIVLDAVTELVLEHEIFCEIVALSQLVPMELDPVLESVARTGALVTAEEGTLTGGFGAEIAARAQEAAWSDLRAPVQRIAARDAIIPSARPLEDEMLPSVEDVVRAVMSLEGAS